MSPPWFWQCLELPPDASAREVKRRYSQLLKLNRPEDNPQGFQQLRAAYEICLRLAQQREAEQAEAAQQNGQAAAHVAHPVAPAPADATAQMQALLANTLEQAAAAAQQTCKSAAPAPLQAVAAEAELSAEPDAIPANPRPQAQTESRPLAFADGAPPPPHLIDDDPPPRPPHPAPFIVDGEPPPAPWPPRPAPAVVDGDPPPVPRPPSAVFEGDPPPAAPLIDGNPPPAPRHPIDVGKIGKFLPVDIAPPVMREATVVVDELLLLNGDNEAVVTRWFARCPELMNFTQRDAVELELLRRIAAGTRPAALLLQHAGQEFGWFELGLARRLAARGVSAAQWQAIDEALREAFALAQFADHLRQGQPLVPHLLSDEFEKELLRKLRAEREQPPSLLSAFRPSTVLHVNELLHAYGQRYGGRALYHVFGPRLLHFWRDLHAGSAANWTRLKMTVLRVAVYTSLIWLVLMVLAFSSRDAAEPFPGRDQRDLTQLLMLGGAAVIAYRAGRMGLGHFLQVLWPRFASWRERLLEIHVEPWLRPLRALPLLLGIAALALLGDHLLGNGASVLLVGTLALALFGLSGLISLLPPGLLLAMAVLLWEPKHPLWFAAGASAALGLLWLGDRLARRKPGTQPRWERRFVHVLLLSVLVCAVSFGVKLTLST